MSDFPDFVVAPSRHPWLGERRQEALDRARLAGLPTQEAEDWRHSRIAELDLERFPAATEPAAEDKTGTSPTRQIIESMRPFSQLVVTRDGFLVHQAGEGVSGLSVMDLSESPRPLASEAQTAPDVFAELNSALAPSPLLIETRANTIVTEPIVISHRAWTANTTCYPRTIVHAGQKSELTVVELWSSAAVNALMVPRTEIVADDDAIVRHVIVSDLDPITWQIASTTCRAGPGASITSATVALGGDYSRYRIDADLISQGGEVRLWAAYFGDGNQVQDFRTLQDHSGKRTTSDLTFKGAVTGSARSVYSGLIRVNPGASASSAFLTNRNLVLSENAGAYSVPNLEIVNENDLRSCGHAATSGPIDPDQVFYLESRGVPTDQARRLIVLGFFDDVLNRVPVPALRPLVRARVAAKLDAAASLLVGSSSAL